jgi:hypothetical protein
VALAASAIANRSRVMMNSSGPDGEAEIAVGLIGPPLHASPTSCAEAPVDVRQGIALHLDVQLGDGGVWSERL